jgi:hypothetical protein
MRDFRDSIAADQLGIAGLHANDACNNEHEAVDVNQGRVFWVKFAASSDSVGSVDV